MDGTTGLAVGDLVVVSVCVCVTVCISVATDCCVGVDVH